MAFTKFRMVSKRFIHNRERYKVYRQHLSIPLAVLGKTPGETIVDLSFQGCSDKGFCYPPESQQIKLSIDKNLALNAVNIENPVLLWIQFWHNVRLR